VNTYGGKIHCVECGARGECVDYGELSWSRTKALPLCPECGECGSLRLESSTVAALLSRNAGILQDHQEFLDRIASNYGLSHRTVQVQPPAHVHVSVPIIRVSTRDALAHFDRVIDMLKEDALRDMADELCDEIDRDMLGSSGEIEAEAVVIDGAEARRLKQKLEYEMDVAAEVARLWRQSENRTE
jgi:hypothetical protein